jgi:hypothetical protein
VQQRPIERIVTERRVQRPGSRCAAALLAVVAWWLPGAVAAVEPEVDADARVREVGPELFYMEGDEGSLVPVPGLRYRDFMDLLRVKEGLAGPLQPPAAVLDKVVARIDGRAISPPADEPAGRSGFTCPATIEFTITQSAAGWAMVPLESAGLLLSGPPRHDGPGRMLVDAAPGGGYRAWFDARPEPGGDVRHVVVLEGRVPVETGSDQDAFTIRIPAAVASRIEVATARAEPEVRTEPPAPDRDVAAADGGGSVVALAGVSGETRIVVASTPDAEPRAAAEAVTEAVVRVDGRNATTEATISLTRLAAGDRPLRISLPPRSVLREVRPPAAVVARGGTPETPTIDVSVPLDAAGKATVSLSCERPIDPSGAAAFDPVGFAVDGISPWRQWGRLSLLVDGDWQVTWADTTDVRRVDPPAFARRPGFIAAFAYDGLPASLAVRVRPRRSRVVIEPEYRYDVGGTRVSLDARFRVAVRGAPINGIAVALDPEWSIDESGPAGAVDVAAVAAEAGVVTIPFTQALAGDAIVELRASRPLAREADRVAWRLPAPRADLVGPAVVVVTSRSDIELLPDTDALTGLVRQTASAAPVSEADRNALVYRLDAAEGAFAAARRFLPRRIEAVLSTQATIDGSEVAVDQALRLNVLHVPLELVELSVPRAIVDAGFEVRRGDELLDPTPVAIETDAAAADEAFRVILPEPLLGAGELTVRYRLPEPDVPPESTVPLDLPQVVPLTAAVGRQSVTVVAAEPLAVGMRGEGWRRDVGPTGGAVAQTWTATRQQAAVPLTLSMRRSDVTRSMVVEAAWLRTRLLPGQREDVATYVVSGVTGPIACTLPGDTAGDTGRTTHEVLLGGTVVPEAVRPGGRVVVETPETDPRRRWRIDIRSVTPRTGGWSGMATRLGLPEPLPLSSPSFDPPVVERRFYWTILARGDERIVGVPASWNSQQRWEPAGFGWSQQPVVSEADLAAWIDAAAGGPIDAERAAATDPPLAGHRFAYSGLGRPAPAVAWLIPDWLILLVSSGAALAFGLTVVYCPWFRRVPVLVVAAAAAGFLAAVAPAVAPLVAQAALPGGVLAVAAWALRKVVEPARLDVGGPGGPGASSLTQLREGASLVVESAVTGGSTATRRRIP